MSGAPPDLPPDVRWREVDPGRLWLVEHPLTAAGMELGRRTTVVRLADGGLWLHSVGRPERAVVARLEALGPVRFLVAASPFHHRWLDDWRSIASQAELHGAPGLPAKRDDLAFDAVLGEEPDPRWAADLDQAAFHGGPRFTEIEFLHRPSRTLILTDLCFDLPPGRGLVTGFFARLLGYHDRFATSRLLRLLVPDRDAARASVERILEWDFDRIVIGHGRVKETGGKAALRDAFAWLLDRPARARS